MAHPPTVATLDLGPAAAFACAVFAGAHWLFRWCQPWVVAVRTSLTPADFTPWARGFAHEGDGRELPVALIGMLVCIGACFEVTRLGRARRVLAFRSVRCLCYGAAAAVVLSIRSSEFSFDAATGGPLIAVAALFLGVAFWAPHAFSEAWVRATAAALFATAVVMVLVFTAGRPSIFDYGFLIGPALKWMQGEPLGTFYMQYSLLLVLVTAGFMRLGLRIIEMQLGLTVLSIAWLALYWWLVRELIRDRALRALFLIGLFAFRLLWMCCQIAGVPQVSPLRMELWLPPVLVARKKGLFSPWTACSFAAMYALDGLFGLLYLAAYLASVGLALKEALRRGEAKASTVLALLVPAALAGIFNLAVFGSVVAKSATRYMDVKIGFLPIAPHSLFWAVLLILLLAVVVFARATNERRFGMFLVLIATAQMTYFLGRSHDHNLINIAGAWILVAFVAIDAALLQARHFARAAASVLIIGVFGLGPHRIVSAVRYAVRYGSNAMVHGPWLPVHPFDQFLDSTRSAWPTNTPSVILMGANDAYMNYRLGLRQQGYYAPVYAHLLNEETAAWLHGAIAQGERVLVPRGGPGSRDALRSTLDVLNRSRFMIERSSGFEIKRPVSEIYFELTLGPP